MPNAGERQDDNATSLEPKRNEGTSRGKLRLSRSPHPYHRRRADLKPTEYVPKTSKDNSSLASTSPQSPRSPTSSDVDNDAIRTKQTRQRQRSTTPSESGTEADDEAYGFIKALPAPPVRPRKGLKDLRGAGVDGFVSPLLTPSYLDEDGRRLSQGYFKARSGQDEVEDEEARAAREKFVQRQRAELVRRASEVALLGTIGFIVLSHDGIWKDTWRWHGAELLGYGVVLLALFLVYPVRLLLYTHSRPATSFSNTRRRIRVPAAFDPAPLIYPTVLPVLINLSLFRSCEKALIPNLVLGLSTLPTQLIPFVDQGHGYSLVHWIISSIPLIVSEHTDVPSKARAAKPYQLKLPSPHGMDPEVVMSLFALHQAIVPPLRYLTTTSLLPAELEIFAVALIDILLFSESPQAVILGSILWIGGLSLFIFCGHVLKWAVELARIPRWRFRRVGQIIKARQSFITLMNSALRRDPSTRLQEVVESDADEDTPPGQSLLRRATLKLDTLGNVAHDLIEPYEVGTKSAVERDAPNFTRGTDSNVELQVNRKRSNTLPILNGAVTTPPLRTPVKRRNNPRITYLSLTPSQANVRKWIYAMYVYFCMVAIILGPIRQFISAYALSGHEPLGWAIGYLFGQIQPLRLWTILWDLENWVVIPPLHFHEVSSTLLQQLGRAEYLRSVIVGEANTRLLICGYCVCVIIVGMAIVLSLSSTVEVDTRRKVFHFMMVAMFLPTIFVDPAFAALALSLVLAIFLLLDLIRASQLPPLSKPLAYFLTPYVDGRDLKGPVVISHIFLLIGCAIPLWLSLAGCEHTGQRPWEGWEVPSRGVSMIAGVVRVGMSDAAASLIGRRYGRRKWPWVGGKSLEGSLAFAVAVTIGLLFGKIWLKLGQWPDEISDPWPHTLIKAWISACGASFMEAVLTGGNDNVIVPVGLWLLVRGLGL